MLPGQSGFNFACSHGGNNQQDDVVNQDQADWKKESPKHRFSKVELFVLIQRCQPTTTARGKEHKKTLLSTC